MKRRGLHTALAGIILLTLFCGLVSAPLNPDDGKLGESGFINWFKSKKIHLGLDLQGGTRLTYAIDLSDIRNRRDISQVVDGITEVVERRVNALGVGEPAIYPSQIGNQHQVVVELPGVKDIDEAIKRVGKTVLLEFKEEKTEYTPEEKAEIDATNETKKTQINEALAKLSAGESFDTVAAEYSEVPLTTEPEYKFADEINMPENYRDQITALESGHYLEEVFEISDPTVIMGPDGNPQVTEDKSMVIARLRSTQEADREVKEEEQRRASHILIAYEGASRADSAVTRTKEEAQAEAEKLLNKILAETDPDFAQYAKDNSDGPSAPKGGDLDFFKEGAMAPAFNDVVFGMTEAETGQVYPEVVETDFGFHIIQLVAIKPAVDTTETQTQYAIDLIQVKLEPEKPQGGWADTGLTGAQFERADVTFDDFGNVIVDILFDEEGGQLFADITKRNIQKPVAIFLDDVLISAPIVQTEITSGSAVISGKFTVDQANELARNLNTGAIAAPISLIGQHTVGASLGEDSLQRGIKAGLVGIIILMIYMIVYYRLPGLMAAVALVIYSLIVVALFKLIPVTLTLAGIAGYILSIGMAVDANILIFERMREEIRNKRDLGQAIEIGFQRAWAAIRDSNISSLITCAILFIFGTSVIKGFALTLAIGVLVSMFSAITITRTFLRYFSRSRKSALFMPRKKPGTITNI